jgi:hypothetical protein
VATRGRINIDHYNKRKIKIASKIFIKIILPRVVVAINARGQPWGVNSLNL